MSNIQRLQRLRGSRHMEALREKPNLWALVAVLLALIAFPEYLSLLLLVAGAELGYLALVPDSDWYRGVLQRREDARIADHLLAEKNRAWEDLPADAQERYTALEGAFKQILQNRPEGSEGWFRGVVIKLTYLLEQFLHFSSREAAYVSYLRELAERFNVSPDSRGGRKRRRAAEDDEWIRRVTECVQEGYETEMERLRERLRQAAGKTGGRALSESALQTRLDILAQRHQLAGRVAEVLDNLAEQQRLIEDSFGLINDQLRTMSPEQLQDIIAGVVGQTDSMTKLLEETGAIEQTLARPDHMMMIQ